MAKEVKKKTYKAAKSARSVDISKTQWKTGVAGSKGKAGRLYGPKGKRFTGSVDLGGGKTAVYKQGKRVTRQKTQGGGFTGYSAPSSSRGRAQTSSQAMPETTSLPPRGKTPAERVSPTTYNPGAGTGTKNLNGGSASGSKDSFGAAMSASRKEFASRTAKARQRQSTVKGTAAKGAAYAFPLTRPAAIGYGLLTSGTAKEAGQTVSKAVKKASRWWQGY